MMLSNLARVRTGKPVATLSEGAPRRTRLPELDLFKTMLVVGMVATHVIQLVGRMLPDWTDRFVEFINLITFSGFLLAMGIGLGLSSGRARPWGRRLLPVLLLLLAAWLSSFAFAILVDRERLTSALVTDVLAMQRLFGWSEFLATFFVLYLAVALMRPLLIWVASNWFLLALASAACLASTWLVMDQGWPLTATLIGTNEFACFPLVPYLPWFLVGISIGRAGGRVSVWHWLAALAASGWLAWTLWQTGELPERFPPTVLWITGSALPLLLYLFVARVIATRIALPGWLTLPGRHVLSYLMVSNLVLFLLRNQMGWPVFNICMWLSLTTAIVVVIGAAWLIWEMWRNRRPGRTLSRSASA
jgi:hypothetical protein